MPDTLGRAVRFDRYGDLDVLYLADISVPEPTLGEVVVAVHAAGINPGEAMIRSGALHERLPATFPSGQGRDLAGIVTAVGPDVDGFVPGDEVLGWSWRRSSHATHTTVPVGQLIIKPPQLSWEVAGGLFVAGTTAFAAVEAVDPQPGETVAVSAAAGGVGTLAVQLLVRRGVRVLGIASPANADWLTAHGVLPVSYGGDVTEQLRVAAGTGAVDAFIDLFGPQYIDVAINLGISPNRIESVVHSRRAQEVGAKTDGSVQGATPAILTELAGLIATGELEQSIAATYPLDRVADAFDDLDQRHTRGKIVLIP